MSVQFDGRLRVIPGAYSAVKARASANRSTTGRTIAIVGNCTGGEPLAVHEFYDPAVARATLRSGNLLDACMFAWHPSPEYGGADKILAVRCASTCIQGTMNLQDSQPANVIAVSTRDYGAWVNNLRLKVENGTNVATYAGVKKVTIENQEYPGIYEIGDDLGLGIVVRYTGDGTDCLLTITYTGANAVQLATTCAGASGDNLTIDLTKANADTLQKLVNLIASEDNYTAVLVGTGSRPSADLDAQTAANIKAADTHLCCVLDGVIDWINENSEYLSAAQSSTSENGAPANVGWTTFSNGSDGTEDATAYESALTLLAAETDIAYIVAATPTLAYMAMVLEHVLDMERLHGLRQRAFFGGSASDEITTAKTNMAQVANARSVYCYPGIQRANESDVLTEYGGWALAAEAAGLSVALHRQRSLTHVPVYAGGVTKKLTKAEIADLIESGATVAEIVPGRNVRIVQAVTTAVSGDAFWKEQSNVDLADYLVVTLEGNFEEKYVGQFGNATLVQDISEETRTFLAQCESEGILVGDEDNPAYRSIVVRMADGVVSVSYEARIAGATNYVLQTANVTLGSAVQNA